MIGGSHARDKYQSTAASLLNTARYSEFRSVHCINMTSPSTTTAAPLQVFDHVVRPEFVVRLHIGPDQTTATLYAYRGELAAAAGLPWQQNSNEAPRPAGIADVVISHVNRSRGMYYNGSRHFNWGQQHDYDEKGLFHCMKSTKFDNEIRVVRLVRVICRRKHFKLL